MIQPLWSCKRTFEYMLLKSILIIFNNRYVNKQMLDAIFLSYSVLISQVPSNVPVDGGIEVGVGVGIRKP